MRKVQWLNALLLVGLLGCDKLDSPTEPTNLTETDHRDVSVIINPPNNVIEDKAATLRKEAEDLLNDVGDEMVAELKRLVG